MPIPAFTQGYPLDGSSLGQTKSTIRDNLDGTFLTLAVDHINNNGQPGPNPAGYHNVIHVVSQGADPSPVASYGQLYSKVTNPGSPLISDTSLFWETATGLIQQLTTNLTPTAVSITNGYTFLPGGIIIQWGAKSAPGQSGSVTFNVTFPNNCFSVMLTQRRDGSSSTQGMYLNGAPTASAFSYNGSTSSDTALYWLAIGN